MSVIIHTRYQRLISFYNIISPLLTLNCRKVSLQHKPIYFTTIDLKNSTGDDSHLNNRNHSLVIPFFTRSVSGHLGKQNFSTAIVEENMTTINGTTPNPAIQLSSVPRPQLSQLVETIDAVMFDCDGVIWHGNDTLENAQSLIIKLREMGKKVFFITNNSNRTREEFLEKFNTLGFQATVEEIVGTAYLTALYFQELEFKKKIYVVGSLGVTQELNAVGIETLPIGPDVISPTSTRWSAKDYQNVQLDPDVGAVVVGFDQHFSYLKMLKAASYLKNKNCLFIATNTDEQFPGPDNMIFPGTGTFVNAVKTAAAREPIIMGKPEKFPFELLSKQHNLKPERVLMVGDRGNTDILFGRKCGLKTLLVLTGVTDIETMHKWEQSEDPIEKLCIPDYYLQDVNEFYQLLLSL